MTGNADPQNCQIGYGIKLALILHASEAASGAVQKSSKFGRYKREGGDCYLW